MTFLFQEYHYRRGREYKSSTQVSNVLMMTISWLLSPLMWVLISIRARCTALCDKVCQWLATGWGFSPGLPVSSTIKTDCHDIAEIFLKVALNTIKQTKQTANIKNIQLLMWLLYRSQYWHAVEYNFLLGSDNSIFEEKKKI